jgi:hypothetical protein
MRHGAATQHVSPVVAPRGRCRRSGLGPGTVSKFSALRAAHASPKRHSETGDCRRSATCLWRSNAGRLSAPAVWGWALGDRARGFVDTADTPLYLYCTQYGDLSGFLLSVRDGHGAGYSMQWNFSALAARRKNVCAVTRKPQRYGFISASLLELYHELY